MQSIALDPLLLILEYCDLSIVAVVNKLWCELAGDIQTRCGGRQCLFKHPRCMLSRPYDVAAVAARYDYVYPLKWLVHNSACYFYDLKWFCMGRWDLYRNVYQFLTGKNKSWLVSLPQTDHDFVQACHQGKHIVSPFNMTIGSLPLRGQAASHASSYNHDAQFITFDVRERRLFGVIRYRVDVSRQFHDHDLDAIKQLTRRVKHTTPIYIRSLESHIGVCSAPHRCNCVEICEWIIKHKTLESGCHYQYGMLKYHLRRLGIQVSQIPRASQA